MIGADDDSLIWEIDVGNPIVNAYQLEVSNSDIAVQGGPLELVSHPVQVTLFREQKVSDNYEAILMSNEVRSIPPNALVRSDGTRQPSPNSLMLPKNYEEDWTCLTDETTSLPAQQASVKSESHNILMKLPKI